MTLRLNKTLATIPPSGIRKFFEIVAEQPDVISLSVGEPDFDAPWCVREAAIAALENGDTHYTGNKGLPELRKAITNYFSKRFHADYDAENEVLVGNGASEIFDITIRAILNPGDEVILLSPSYVMYAPLIQLAGGVPIFTKNIQGIEKQISSKTKAIILSYPSNPTGETFDKKELHFIAKIVKENQLFVISDEIYAELTYDKAHIAFASLPDMKQYTATISGFSKAFALTGFRLGYLLASEELVAATNKIHQYSALCANSISQKAALEALQNCSDEVEKMREEYQIRRDFFSRELNQMGIKTKKPAGAFYLFPNVKKKTGLSGEKFALRLLKSEKVAVVPGNAFGSEFDDFIRISYATGLRELEIAAERMRRFVLSHS
jgi:aminotransferase